MRKCLFVLVLPTYLISSTYYCKTCNKFRLTCKVWPQQNSSFEQRVSKFIPQINTHRICKLHRQWAPELWSPFTVQGHWRSAVRTSWIKRSIRSKIQKGPLYYEELLHSTETFSTVICYLYPNQVTATIVCLSWSSGRILILAEYFMRHIHL